MPQFWRVRILLVHGAGMDITAAQALKKKISAAAG
jgi:hypothetical protein